MVTKAKCQVGKHISKIPKPSNSETKKKQLNSGNFTFGDLNIKQKQIKKGQFLRNGVSDAKATVN